MVTEDRIEKALRKVARFVASDPSLLPVFEKLENERAVMRSHKSAMTRALELAESGANEIVYKANGLSNAAV